MEGVADGRSDGRQDFRVDGHHEDLVVRSEVVVIAPRGAEGQQPLPPRNHREVHVVEGRGQARVVAPDDVRGLRGAEVDAADRASVPRYPEAEAAVAGEVRLAAGSDLGGQDASGLRVVAGEARPSGGGVTEGGVQEVAVAALLLALDDLLLARLDVDAPGGAVKCDVEESARIEPDGGAVLVIGAGALHEGRVVPVLDPVQTEHRFGLPRLAVGVGARLAGSDRRGGARRGTRAGRSGRDPPRRE